MVGSNTTEFVLEREHFQSLFDVLIKGGYRVIGPVVRDGTITYDDLANVEDMPIGWTDEQEAGIYRIKQRSDKALFGYNVSPQSWKKFLYPPVTHLWEVTRTNGFRIIPNEQEPPRFAFVGVRACELHAITIQDNVFLRGNQIDTTYQTRRNGLFVVAINCVKAGDTCFCASMNTGPKATVGYDLALTEVLDSDRHYFVVEVGSDDGYNVINQLPHQIATREEKQIAERLVAAAQTQMGRTLDTSDIQELLYHNSEHPYWENIAQRCLGCANCTMVCPTCFCSTIEDVTNLTGDNAERVRKWDSCFTADFSYIHGGSVRSSLKARYRQWLTHKFAYWVEQFGTSGCVGCGRCITWCPVGIDVTKEVQSIRETASAPKNARKAAKNGNA